MEPTPPLRLTLQERCTLEAWASARSCLDATTSKRALRANIVLVAESGLDARRIATRLGVRPSTARKWLERFVQDRLAGLGDRPRSGAPRRISDARVAEVLLRTLEPTPKGAHPWSRRMMAKATRLSRSTVHRIWRKFEIAPDRLTPAK
ncbi:MAG: helix-turn-helix domain containing protein [Polyangiaceae bacterium]|nr:helix-turn-helix domain containing protein [Polyangiaceae bacterium]